MMDKEKLINLFCEECDIAKDCVEHNCRNITKLGVILDLAERELNPYRVYRTIWNEFEQVLGGWEKRSSNLSEGS